MKLRHNFILPFILVILGAPKLQAQNFEAGYLVTSKGDTLKGFISTEKLLGKKILFKKNTYDKDIQAFSPLEFQSFFIRTDNDYFFPAIVDVDVKSVNELHLDNDPSPKFVRDTVILRMVSSGKAKLYTLKDVEKEHFFLQLEQGEIHELLYIKYFIAEKFSKMELETFKQQLKNELTGCSMNVMNLYYSESSLKKIVDKYNLCTGVVVVVGQGEKRIQSSFYIIGGASMSLNNSYLGTDLTGQLPRQVMIHPAQMSYSNKTSSTLGLGFQFKSSKPSNRFSFGSELFWRQFSTEASSNYSTDPFVIATTTSSFDFQAVQLNLLAQHNFRGKLSPYINIGVSVNYYTKKDSHYTYSGTNTGVPFNYSGLICTFDSFSFGFFGGAGINYERFIFSARIESLPANSSSPTSSQFQAINLNLLLGYKIKK